MVRRATYSDGAKLLTSARNVAESRLVDALPRRWDQVQAVATETDRVSVMLAESDHPALVTAAWLYGIGYAADTAANGLHALMEGWLRARGFD